MDLRLYYPHLFGIFVHYLQKGNQINYGLLFDMQENIKQPILHLFFEVFITTIHYQRVPLTKMDSKRQVLCPSLIYLNILKQHE